MGNCASSQGNGASTRQFSNVNVVESESKEPAPATGEKIPFEKLRKKRSPDNAVKKFDCINTFGRGGESVLGEIIEDDLKTAFDRIKGGSHQGISMAQFDQVCKEMGSDLGQEEISRVFANIDVDSSGHIDFGEFVHGMKHRKFLANLFNAKGIEQNEFEIPEKYNWKRSTSENYSVPKAEEGSPKNKEEYAGENKEIRMKMMDYNYHSNFTLQRQDWQDKIVSRVVEKTSAQTMPWMVFTAGAPGVGKKQTLQWMSANGFFPLENVVHIDSDQFKHIMPEWNGYRQKDNRAKTDKAASLCHRESGFLQEMCQHAAMKKNQNIWVEGTLRSSAWHAANFDRIRKHFPQYRIALFNIKCDEETLRARIKQRFEATGRGVPENIIREGLQASEQSLSFLTSKVDFVANIDNSGRTPVLDTFFTVNRSRSWNLIANRFNRGLMGPDDFPQFLAPLLLSRVRFKGQSCSQTLEIGCDDGGGSWKSLQETDIKSYRLNLWCKVKQFPFDNNSILAERIITKVLKQNGKTELILKMSPACLVNLDAESRRYANVPENAQFFSWVYSISSHMAELLGSLKIAWSNNLIGLLLTGAFVYFDASSHVVAVNMCGEDSRNKNMLQFGPKRNLGPGVVAELTRQNRWSEVTLKPLLDKGAIAYCWINPLEIVHGTRLCVFGGFAYLFHTPEESWSEKDCFFPIMGSE